MVSEDQVLGLLGVVYALAERGVDLPTGRFLLNTALAEALQIDWSERIGSIVSPKDMHGFVAHVQGSASMLRQHDAVKHNPLLNPAQFLVHEDRFPVGVKHIDEMMGGGVARGEMVGLLGPTGGGKTVTAVDVVTEQALRRKHVMYFTFEQELKGDIMQRLMCRMTGFPMSAFRDKSYAELALDVRDAVDRAGQEYGIYLEVVDLSKGGGGTCGPLEMIAEIESSIKAGRSPQLIVVDWLGASVVRQLASLGLDVDSSYRRIANNTIDTLRMAQKRMGFATLMLHQLSTKMARTSPSKRPAVTDAHEYKSFAFDMDACLCLGCLSPGTRVGYMIIDKSRRGPIDECLVQLDAEHMLFRRVDASSVVADHTGEFVPVAKAPEDMEEKVSKRAKAWH